MAPLQDILTTFVEELRRRRVFRVVAIYAGSAFIILQVLDGMSEVIDLPDWIGKVIVFGLLVGFPISAIFAWIFDLTKTGIVRTPSRSEMAAMGTTTLPGERATGGPNHSSIAVMPFTDMSDEQDQGHFGDGMTEEIIETLKRIQNLSVVSRTSTFALRNITADVREIGRRLGVGTVLEGSLRKSGDQIRITVQLIDVSSGFQIWSHKYDRSISDVFAVQDEIASRIVKELKVVLSEGELSSARKPPTEDFEAYDYYLRGREFFYTLSVSSIGHAIKMFTQATEVDPRYARAYAGLADCHSVRFLYFGGKEEDVIAARATSGKALELDPDLAEAHVSHGWALSLTKLHDEAEAEFDLAIQMAPRLFEAYYFYGRASWSRGEMAKAARLFETAAEIRPREYQVPLLLAGIYAGLGDKEKSLATYAHGLRLAEKRLEWNPDDVRALYLSASALVALGDLDKGLALAEKALAMDPNDPAILYNVACAYATAGNPGRALDLLERVITGGFSSPEWILNDNSLSSLRGEPRFQTLLKSRL